MIARSIVVLAAATASLPALAFSPWEAANAAQRIGRPVPAMVRVEHHPDVMYAVGTRLPVFLNRHGGSYNCGNDDSRTNTSSVVCGSNGAGDVGAFSGDDNDWDDVMACVTDQFSRFNITVTDQEPLSGHYVEAVVGGISD